MGNIFCLSSDDADAFEVHLGFRSLIPRYDAFILDQWGVMHNGAVAMDGAVECVQEMVRQGKKLAILSNTPGSEAMTLDKLPELGFVATKGNLFEAGAVTSGDLASAYIFEQYGKLHKKAMVLAWGHPNAPNVQDFLVRCGDIELVDWHNDDDATIPDCVILQGAQVIMPPGNIGQSTANSGRSLGSFLLSGDMTEVIVPLLRRCRERSVPVICIDPDLVTVEPDGTVYHMPGQIAEYYEKTLNGPTLYFGKPNPRAFRRAVDRLTQTFGIPPHRICHVGDSLHHDIRGANAVGLDSTLVLGGVHRVELLNELGELAPRDKLRQLFAEVGETPTHVAPMLKL